MADRPAVELRYFPREIHDFAFHDARVDERQAMADTLENFPASARQVVEKPLS